MPASENQFILPVAVAGFGCLLIGWWLSDLTGTDTVLRLPGEDAVPQATSDSDDPPEIVTAGQPVTGPGSPSEVVETWPGFRGPNRDAIAIDQPKLARAWPDEGPPLLWSIELGEDRVDLLVSRVLSAKRRSCN